ncbi:MAG TPA: outer membrane protein assembly factor BamD [Candidatus Azoamicus sp.]
MLIKNLRIVIFFLLSFNFYVCCYALDLTDEDKLKIFNNKISYNLGQKYFNESNYLLSSYIFNSLIRDNEIYNKYSYKSKTYKALSKFKRGKIRHAKRACKNILTIKHIMNRKCLNCVYFLKGIILFNPSKNIILKLNKYKIDQTFIKKAFRSFSRIKTNSVHTMYDSFVTDIVYKVEVEIKKNSLYIANYYFKKGAYISVIKRLHHFNHSCKDEYDFYSNYLLLRSYNELYLSDISEKLLHFKPSKYFKQRSKKIQ